MIGTVAALAGGLTNRAHRQTGVIAMSDTLKTDPTETRYQRIAREQRERHALCGWRGSADTPSALSARPSVSLVQPDAIARHAGPEMITITAWTPDPRTYSGSCNNVHHPRHHRESAIHNRT